MMKVTIVSNDSMVFKSYLFMTFSLAAKYFTEVNFMKSVSTSHHLSS